MPEGFKTPGVYIKEENAFPGSAVAVATAIPVFIGYTQKAVRFGKSLKQKPTKVTSFAEYVEWFGGEFKAKFTVEDFDPKSNLEPFHLNGKDSILKVKKNNNLYFFNSIRLFYANGGSECYILAVDTYDGKTEQEVLMADFIGDPAKGIPNVFELLEKEQEPTLIVFPDIVALGEDAYELYKQALAHCAKTQSRFGVFDVAYQAANQTTDEVVGGFRNKIGNANLNYGAVYYPWLKTSVIQPNELTFENFDDAVDLMTILPEKQAQEVITKFKATAAADINDVVKKNYHQSLKATSTTYTHLLEEIRAQLNELPSSAAIAGIYTAVDSSRGVWKAPANISVNNVNAPSVSISNQQQQNLNVDAMAGLSINVIRPFPGVGILVWGARTLDGNSQDWRYINVRRTLIMIEQSLKLATRTYVFEPNNSSTWITISSMFNNFLYNLWTQGALVGAAPEQAYSVSVGLGSTMTANDILDGIMRITVKVAVVRPAEFIEITFQQQQQQS